MRLFYHTLYLLLWSSVTVFTLDLIDSGQLGWFEVCALFLAGGAAATQVIALVSDIQQLFHKE